MTPLDQLPHKLNRDNFSCQAVLEAPAGSRVKVYYDPVSHRFRTGKFLPLGMAFPLDFAFIPSTLAEDGDPVDLLIMPEADLPVGVVVNVRILGILEAEQKKVGKKAKRNDRVIARLSESKLFAQLDHINQLGEKFVIEMSSFFSTYKQLRGQSYTVLRVGGPERAADLIEQAAKEFASSPNGSG